MPPTTAPCYPARPPSPPACRTCPRPAKTPLFTCKAGLDHIESETVSPNKCLQMSLKFPQKKRPVLTEDFGALRGGSEHPLRVGRRAPLAAAAVGVVRRELVVAAGPVRAIIAGIFGPDSRNDRAAYMLPSQNLVLESMGVRSRIQRPSLMWCCAGAEERCQLLSGSGRADGRRGGGGGWGPPPPRRR